MKKIVSYFICVTLVLCHGVTRAQAQGASLSVSPAVTEIILAPNKQASQTFILKSNTDDLVVTPELHLFQPADQNGHAKIFELSVTDQKHALVLDDYPENRWYYFHETLPFATNIADSET